MPETVLHLGSAAITFYDAPPSGLELPSGVGIFMGYCPNGCRLGYQWDEVRSYPTGVPYGIPHHVNESHTIDLTRVAVVDDDNGEFLPERDNFYALKIQWVNSSGSGVVERTYYNVKPKSLNMDSQGVEEFNQEQSFTAQFFTSTML